MNKKTQKRFVTAILLLILTLSGLAQAADTFGNSNPYVNMIWPNPTPLKDVLAALNMRYGVNIVADENIQNLKVSIYLKEVRLKRALQILVDTHGLTFIRENNIYKVSRRDKERKMEVAVDDGRITMDVRNISIRKVLREIANQSGLNIVPDSTVSGEVSIRINDVTFEEGFATFLSSNGFTYARVNSIYRVSKREGRGGIFSVMYYKPKGTSDGLLTVDVSKQNILQVLREISLQTRQNIVATKDVKGDVSLHFSGLPLERGLRILAEAYQYRVAKSGNLYVVWSAGRKKNVSQHLLNVSHGRVSINAANTSIARLLRELADQADINIMTLGKIEGTVAMLRGENREMEDVLDQIFRNTELTYKKVGDLYIVGPADAVLAMATSRVSEQMIEIKNLEAVKVISMLPPQVDRDKVKVITQRNALIIGGTVNEIKAALAFIKRIDHPQPKVKINAWLISIPKSGKFPYGDLGLAVPEKTETSVGVLGFNGVQAAPANLASRIAALASAGKINIIARPETVTLSNQAMAFSVGSIEHVPEKQQSETAKDNTLIKTMRVKGGVKVSLIPIVTGGGRLRMSVQAETTAFTNVDKDGMPVLSTRGSSATTEMGSGQVMILSGLYHSEKLIERKEIKTKKKGHFLFFSIPVKVTDVKISQNVKEERLHLLIVPDVVDEAPALAPAKTISPAAQSDETQAEQVQPGNPAKSDQAPKADEGLDSLPLDLIAPELKGPASSGDIPEPDSGDGMQEIPDDELLKLLE